MVIVVKKYLFLLVLFIIYLILKVNAQEETMPVFSYDNEQRSIKNITIRFENGINSTELSNKFKEYENDYLISGIKLDDREFNLECNDIEQCLNDIFCLEDKDFNQKYLLNGFKINEVNFISYDDSGTSMLSDEDFICVNN